MSLLELAHKVTNTCGQPGQSPVEVIASVQCNGLPWPLSQEATAEEAMSAMRQLVDASPTAQPQDVPMTTALPISQPSDFGDEEGEAMLRELEGVQDRATTPIAGPVPPQAMTPAIPESLPPAPPPTPSRPRPRPHPGAQPDPDPVLAQAHRAL